MLLLAMRCAKLALGLVWSGGLIILGLWMWEHGIGRPAHVVTVIAAGEFVLMWMVLDDLCPQASVAVTGLLKLAAAGGFWIGGIVSLWPWLTRLG